MATSIATLPNINIPNANKNPVNSEKNTYVHIDDFNKLKTKFEKKIKENNQLKEYLENVMNSYEQISETKKSVEKIFDSIKETIKTNKFFSKSREDFSTTYSHYEYLGSTDIKTSSKTCTCNMSNLNLKDLMNLNFLKKIEAMEISYNEILQNFNLLISKYKVLKEEKEKIEENNNILRENISELTEFNNNLNNELNEANITIERFKEIDKCLVDSTINSLFLNSKERKNYANENKVSIHKNKEDLNNVVNYVLCEPVPSFVKFINKFTK